jgi:hypothetical protein
MSSLADWITKLPKENQRFASEITSELWDVFSDLDKNLYLLTTIFETPERKDFLNIIPTSNGLMSAFNMLYAIPTLQEKLIYGRNREFVEHNKKYGFNENSYLYLLLSESISVFLRNIELFRCCFLFVLKTVPKKVADKYEYPFHDVMGIGTLLRKIAKCTGASGERIMKRVNVDLRNGLTHGLVWKGDGLNIFYSKDIAFTEIKKIGLDELWKEASYQSMVTQCLINLIPAWYDTAHK